ncbi:hypothetical protein ACH5RR_009197 [Cinchona calisaya]|uniref:Uncharacterized protein n=1 Tax=Cinchona calisaya TaxID=153742 RepID=A0ABD3AH81_9GENT
METLSLGESFHHHDRLQKPQISIGSENYYTTQKKCPTRLMGLDYEVPYKKGKHNVVVDTLSRREGDMEEERVPEQINAISAIKPNWLSEVVGSYKEDS